MPTSTDLVPFNLNQPMFIPRRKERPRRAPIPPDILARRNEIARVLNEKINVVSTRFRDLSEPERRAVFFKLEHEVPISLDGTGLKGIAEPTEHFTLAIPRTNELGKLMSKITEFGEGNIKNGHAPNEQLGAFLQDIKFGDPKDRLSEALLKDYDQLIRQDNIICEIEIISIFPRSMRKKRIELDEIRRDLERAFARGVHGNFYEHEEIKGTCRAVIRCTGNMFKKLVEDKEWQTKISWFDAKPEFQTFYTTFQEFNFQKLGPIISPNENSPIICIVDTGLTQGNPFLQPVTKDELIRSFLHNEPDSPQDDFGHGSGVASLASYYALNVEENATNHGKVWIASARILNQNNEGDERLLSKVLTEIVDTFVPMGVRIYNLSVNIRNRRWDIDAKRTVPRRSWVARTIDKISREKDVVFIISTGNLSLNEIREFHESGQAYPLYFLSDEVKILDPAQAALAVTVGSIVPGTLAIGPMGSNSAIAQINQPSPFTRSGPGICREIKPELVDFGGNYLIDNETNITRTNPGTNVMMASNKLTPALMHDAGTSLAAPRVAHKMALILEELQILGLEYISAVLLKAFIINSAVLREEEEFLNFIKLLGNEQKQWLNIYGYGIPDNIRALYCDQHSVILFYQGEIIPDNVAYFEIPIPNCMVRAGKKKLTITVVHAPEVQRWGLERYLGTTLKWRLFRGDTSREEIIEAMSTDETEEGTEERAEMPNEIKLDLGVTLRSRGTIQHDFFEWTIHRPEYSENNYTLAICSYEKWGVLHPKPVPFAVVVRIEDISNTVELYNEIKARIQVRARA